MVAMFAIFRRAGTDGHAAWLDFSYWEILGLIGWTYLAVSILYIPTRRWRWAPLAWLVCLVALNAASTGALDHFQRQIALLLLALEHRLFLSAHHGRHRHIDDLPERYPGRHGKAESSMGLRLCRGSLSGRLAAHAPRHLKNTSHAHLGSLLRRRRYPRVPCVVLGLRRAQACPLGAIVKPAGSNTLLTYLLPDLFFVTLGGLAWLNPWGHGWQGVMQSLIFTLVILGIIRYSDPL